MRAAVADGALPRSNTWTMFACDRRTASLASWMNMSTKSWLRASSGRIRLMTRIFSKPSTP